VVEGKYPRLLLNCCRQAGNSTVVALLGLAEALFTPRSHRAASLPQPPLFLRGSVRFRILHHDSKSCCSLQVADYFNWAVYRRWDRGDDRSLNLVKRAVKSQFDIFRTVGVACSLILW
jgi:hypothetical protein